MQVTSKLLNLLVVEDNEGDFVLFEAYLQQTQLKVKSLHHAKAMSEVNASEMDIDIAFLDLSLPDSGGIESFIILKKHLPDVPIVVLSGVSDETIALQCIALGAQDYLLKNDLNEKFLEKSVYYSIERRKILENISATNRQYELIGNITNDVILKLNLNTNEIVYTKKSFFGYTDGEIEKTMEWWVTRIHPDDQERVSQLMTSLVERTITNAQVEFRFRSADGSFCHLFSRAVIVQDKGNEYQLVCAIMDITERKELEKDLVNAQLNMQRQMTEAMMLGQEKQKEEIGKELHDNITQVMASVKLYIETAIDNPNLRDEMLARSKKNIVYAIDEIRKLSHSLVPPSLGDHGLFDALRELIAELNQTGFFAVKLVSEDFDESLIDADKKLMLYRIIQEQINNIMKYAKASKVAIGLTTSPSELRLSISDNGVGFDTAKKAKGIGLKNIDSRVAYYSGRVVLTSSPGKGTSLEVFLPL